MSKIEEALKLIREEIEGKSLTEKVQLLNHIRTELHELSPFKSEPVDLVLWVPAETVVANDYNPNKVASPEMQLLYISIKEDGYTQPIVTCPEDGVDKVMDGFHRNRIGKERKDILKRVHGYLPVARSNKKTEGERMAATIRHNRARGEHKTDLMAEIIRKYVNLGWSDDVIAKHLGMEFEEVLRLKQIEGIAELYRGRSFSRSWETRKFGEDMEQELENISIGGEEDGKKTRG